MPPSQLALDLHRRKGRRQRAARHDVLVTERLMERVEIDLPPRADIDRAQAQTLGAAVEAIEVDDALERLAKDAGVVIADRGQAAGLGEVRAYLPRREEAGLAQRRGGPGAPCIEEAAQQAVLGREGERPADRAPERLELLQPALTRIARHDRGIDGADRGPREPFGLVARLVERLIGADLIGTQGAAALQHQRHLSGE